MKTEEYRFSGFAVLCPQRTGSFDAEVFRYVSPAGRGEEQHEDIEIRRGLVLAPDGGSEHPTGQAIFAFGPADLLDRGLQGFVDLPRFGPTARGLGAFMLNRQARSPIYAGLFGSLVAGTRGQRHPKATYVAEPRTPHF